MIKSQFYLPLQLQAQLDNTELGRSLSESCCLRKVRKQMAWKTPLMCPPKEKQEAEAEPEMDSPTPSKCSSIYKRLLCKVFGFYMIKIENSEL